jgi:hypothetical protein
MLGSAGVDDDDEVTEKSADGEEDAGAPDWDEGGLFTSISWSIANGAVLTRIRSRKTLPMLISRWRKPCVSNVNQPKTISDAVRKTRRKGPYQAWHGR